MADGKHFHTLVQITETFIEVHEPHSVKNHEIRIVCVKYHGRVNLCRGMSHWAWYTVMYAERWIEIPDWRWIFSDIYWWQDSLCVDLHLDAQRRGFSRFIEWKALVEKSMIWKLKTLRTDNGGEYVSAECRVSKVLEEGESSSDLSVTKTPEQNGVAERMNRTLFELCWLMRGSHIVSGQKHCPRLFTLETEVRQRQLKEWPHLKLGQERNQM